MRSGYDCLKSHVLRCWRNDVNDWADVVSTGRAFQMRGAATEKARLPTVESLTEGTTRRLVLAERSVRRPCRSATGTSGPRYRGSLYIHVALIFHVSRKMRVFSMSCCSGWTTERQTDRQTDIHTCTHKETGLMTRDVGCRKFDMASNIV